MNQQTRIVKTGRKYDQVLQGARDVFMADGFEGASVDDIARKAGVSKATLYSYFPDKRLLFREVVRTECERQACEADELVETTCGPETVLYDTAHRIIAIILSDFSLQMFRICVAESERFPELGQEFYESGPMVLKRGLQEYLEDATARGELKIDDVSLAADQFAELCKAGWLLEAIFMHQREFSDAERHRYAQGAVDTFLARYRA
ncbi:MAG: TetR family transcriptional regulator [Rhodobacteraceae bacterium]|nr:TetR family transcriptional regulator [Paracoccaceae bacterium]